MQFPDDPTLIARGKYSTLRAERKKQLERVRNICTLLITEAQASLRDCELVPPKSAEHVAKLEHCLDNLQDARQRIVELANEMIAIEPTAYPR